MLKVKDIYTYLYDAEMQKVGTAAQYVQVHSLEVSSVRRQKVSPAAQSLLNVCTDKK